MARPFSADAFYGSAREFALDALEAHTNRNYRRVALDAGTALEHLAKAVLAGKSPALLAEMKNNETGFNSVMGLLPIKGVAVPAAKIRTVGLTDALSRAERFATSEADGNDLKLLIDKRNGVVHAAENAGVEERILAAFVKHADALLKALGRRRADFWGGQLPVVNELLKDVGDKVAHRVSVRVRSAVARFENRRAAEGDDVIRALQTVSKSASLADDQRRHECPACHSTGIATGQHSVDWEPTDWDPDGRVTNAAPIVTFLAGSFRCPLCGLRFYSRAEIETRFHSAWEIEDADWHDYEPDYELPENWRDYVDEDEVPEDSDWGEDPDEL